MTIHVDNQDDLPQALYAIEPGFTSVHITRNGTKYVIEVTYDVL